MVMNKVAVSLAAAAALGLAVTATPKPAEAAWWVVPAIVAGTVGGVAVGVAATNANAYYGGPGSVYVAPTPTCHWANVERNGRMFRERICG